MKENKIIHEDTLLIRFGMWLGENGWEFYDSHDRLIKDRTVAPITELFDDYKKEKPEP